MHHQSSSRIVKFFAASLIVLLSCISLSAQDESSIKVACLGDSITAGARVDAETQSYPAQLQKLLGDGYQVRNLGIGGATLIKTGRPNVWRTLERVTEFAPDIVIISLGTNDTVGGNRKNWEQIDRFEADYEELIDKLASLASQPRIVICTPTSMVLTTPDLTENRLANLQERKPRLQALCSRVRKIAESHEGKGVTLLELNNVLKDKPELVSKGDGVHPNADGYRAIAEAVAAHIRSFEMAIKEPLTLALSPRGRGECHGNR